MTQLMFGDPELLGGDRRAGGPVSATALARALSLGQVPTREQAQAVEHRGPGGSLAPYLIVAGAGSGKTETMAARVVWLVANRLVRPERILGLTFTRKAAGELAERVRRRLRSLSASGLLGEYASDWLAGDPAVSTYHAYAGSLFREHALRIGREPSARLLREAATWQYVGRVTDAHAGDMSAIDWMPSTVVGKVRSLAADLAEHLVSTDDIRSFHADLAAAVRSVPPVAGSDRLIYAETLKRLQHLERREQLLPLVDAYTASKARTDSIDFGDQVAHAARIAQEHPVVGELERDRYDVVLLDEYQDTGTAQRALLRALFGGGHPVTAVGDPCQSIYGWRGASSGGLRSFPGEFPCSDGSPAQVVPLTTSFRNGGRILAVANALSGPLRHSGVPVDNLVPGPKGVEAGEVVHACHPDAATEAAWVADLVAVWVLGGEGVPPRFAPHEIAVLTRTRAQFSRLEEALRARGLPVEVSGIGGLLARPEVIDVVATVQVLSDPTAGNAVLRLLTGSRWRIGPRDLDALGRRARRLTHADDEVAAAAEEAEPDAVDERSLVEALDDLGPPPAYSATGYARLAALRDELRGLRRRADQPLPDLLADVIRTMGVDVEVAARPGRDPVDPASARGHLDRLLDVAAEFADTQESPSVGAFLAYLEAAIEHERGLESGRVDVVGDAVSLLTIHGAKGLEWPAVVVPGMTRDLFPGKPRGGIDWCTEPAMLPFPLRGDAADLPVLGVRSAADQKQVTVAYDEHKQACAVRDQLEERRLAYVAVTRAEELLVCSGYWWDHTKAPRGPSVFLTEVRDACEKLGAGAVDAGWAERPADGEANPLDSEPARASWPADPLTPSARAVLDGAAGLVRAAIARHGAEAAEAAPEGVEGATSGLPRPVAAVGAVGAAGAAGAGAAGGAPGIAEAPGMAGTREVAGGAPAPCPALSAADQDRVGMWTREVGELLAERAHSSAHRARAEVALPAHLSVSQLVALRRDPGALAQWLRRPVPVPPAPLARRGTAFHAWLEQRFSAGSLLDLDELPGSADSGAAPVADLALLKERFLASPWADRRPVEVEVAFETPIEGLLVRGRMDAVFRRAIPGGAPAWEVVDWKTGRMPSGLHAEADAIQLAAYRLAWHRLSREPLASIGAAFHYVRDGVTVRPVDLLDAEGLAALIRAVPVSGGARA